MILNLVTSTSTFSQVKSHSRFLWTTLLGREQYSTHYNYLHAKSTHAVCMLSCLGMFIAIFFQCFFYREGSSMGYMREGWISDTLETLKEMSTEVLSYLQLFINYRTKSPVLSIWESAAKQKVSRKCLKLTKKEEPGWVRGCPFIQNESGLASWLLVVLRQLSAHGALSWFPHFWSVLGEAPDGEGTSSSFPPWAPAAGCPRSTGVRVQGISVEASGLLAEGKQMCYVSVWPRFSCRAVSIHYRHAESPAYPRYPNQWIYNPWRGAQGQAPTAFQKQFRVSWERIRKRERMKRETWKLLGAREQLRLGETQSN